MLRFLLITFLFIVLGGCSDHGNAPSGFEARSVTVGETTYGYRVFVPKDRRPDEKLPVMLYLHGSGARGDDNMSQVDGIKRAIAPVQEKVSSSSSLHSAVATHFGRHRKWPITRSRLLINR